MTGLREPLQVAAEILGVDICAAYSRIRYAYYRMMKSHHPDRNGGDPRADRQAALINEAKDLLLGRIANPNLVKDAELVSEVMQQSVSEAEVMSYEEWLRSRFYNMEQCSIWPC
jgi:hypothetical protein